MDRLLGTIAAPRPSEASVAKAPAIELRGLSRSLGERNALAGVDLTVEEGRTLAVLGANGAGKSTLLRILATLLRPTAGTVRVLGFSLPDQAYLLRPHIGWVAHEPMVYRELTVRENLSFHARLHRLPDRGARTGDLLAAVGLSRRADDRVRDLSRGMVQRLAIARAVIARPRLLLLDEPYSHLDPRSVASVEPLLAAAPHRARVLVTHDVHLALGSADWVLGLRSGAMTISAPADALDADTVHDLLYRGAVT